MKNKRKIITPICFHFSSFTLGFTTGQLNRTFCYQTGFPYQWIWLHLPMYSMKCSRSLKHDWDLYPLETTLVDTEGMYSYCTKQCFNDFIFHCKLCTAFISSYTNGQSTFGTNHNRKTSNIWCNAANTVILVLTQPSSWLIASLLNILFHSRNRTVSGKQDTDVPIAMLMWLCKT